MAVLQVVINHPTFIGADPHYYMDYSCMTLQVQPKGGTLWAWGKPMFQTGVMYSLILWEGGVWFLWDALCVRVPQDSHREQAVLWRPGAGRQV